MTLLGLQFAQLLGGAVVTETIFAWPGIGRLVVEAIFDRDFPVVQGVVLVVSLIFVAVNMLVDLAYAALDPAHPLRGRVMRRDPVFWLSAAALGTSCSPRSSPSAWRPFGPDEQDVAKRCTPPGLDSSHILGTDEVGRDILSRLIYGARVSLLVGVIAIGLSCPLGHARRPPRRLCGPGASTTS